jgi:hypothetical protein
VAEDRFVREAQRLKASPPQGTAPGGMGTVQFTAECPGNAARVYQRVKEVMHIISERILSDWPSDEQWKPLLPEWFLSACVPPRTKEESDRFMAWWRSLPPDRQAQVEREDKWSLEGWLYWMIPENRVWTWWDARVLDADTVIVAVEVTDWPFPWGALRWLFRAAGARQLDADA